MVGLGRKERTEKIGRIGYRWDSEKNRNIRKERKIRYDKKRTERRERKRR